MSSSIKEAQRLDCRRKFFHGSPVFPEERHAPRVTQLKQSLSCGVRYVACRVQVASLLSFLGPPWCQRCLVARVCSSHVSGWLTSVEVFAAVPLGVSCLLSCWVGGYFVGRWSVGAQAGCFIAAFGYRQPPRHARTSRVLGSGASGMGANAVDRKSTFFDVFKISARPCWPPLRASTPPKQGNYAAKLRVVPRSTTNPLS